MLERYFRERGLEARDGQIIDATLAPISKQRNSKEENIDIKSDRLQD